MEIDHTFIAMNKYPRIYIYAHSHTHTQGSHLREKSAFFTQKKSRLRKSENAVCLLYAKTVTSHIKMRLVFLFFAPSREGL